MRPPRRPDLSALSLALTRALLLGLSVGFAAWIPFWLSGASIRPDTFFPVPLWGLLLIVLKPAIDRLARSSYPTSPSPDPRSEGRAEVVSALLLAAIAPIVFLGAHAVLFRPLLQNPRFFGAARAVAASREAVFFLGAFLLVPLAAAPPISLLAGRRRPLVDAAIGLLAAIAFGASAALIGASIPAASRLPEPSAYIASVPIVAELPGCAQLPDARPRILRLGDIEIRRTCDGRDGLTEVISPDGSVPAWSSFIERQGGEPIRVRRDDRANRWILERRGARIALHRDDRAGGALRAEDVRATALQGKVSPPWTFLATAVVGLFIAAGCIGKSLRRRAFVRRILQGREGILGERGWIDFPDGEAPMRAPFDLPCGPVIVMPAARRARAIYRADAPFGQASVEPGTKAARLDEARSRIAALLALAFAAITLTAAPLAAAAWVGLFAV